MYHQIKKGFQTNKLDWEGKRLELAGKLKERLRNIYLRDVSSRSFDLLFKLQMELGEM